MTTKPRIWRYVGFCCVLASVGLTASVCWAQGPDDAKRGQRGRQNTPAQGGGAAQTPQRPQRQAQQPGMQQQQRSVQQPQQQQRFNQPSQQQKQPQQFTPPQTGRSSPPPQANAANPNAQRFQGGRATASGTAAGGQPNLIQQPRGARDLGKAPQTGQNPAAGRFNPGSGQPTLRQPNARQPIAGQNPGGAAGGNLGSNPTGNGNNPRSRTPGNNSPLGNPQTGSPRPGGISGSTIPGSNIPPRRPTASTNPNTGKSPLGNPGAGGTFDRGKLGGDKLTNPGGNRPFPGDPTKQPRPGDVGAGDKSNIGGQGGRGFPRRPTAGDDLKIGGNKPGPGNGPGNTGSPNDPLGGRGPRPGRTGGDGAPQIGDAGKGNGKGPVFGDPLATGKQDGGRGNSGGRDRRPEGRFPDVTRPAGNRPGDEKLGGGDRFDGSGRPNRNPTLPPRGSGFQVDASKLKDGKRGPGRDSIGNKDSITNKDLQRVAWKGRVDDRRLEQLTRHPHADKIKLAQQYQLHDRGDVGRRMDLHHQLVSHGGWQNRHMGWVNAGYHNHCFERPYWGPAWYPSHCYYPRWSTWVSWSWGFHCAAVWDPRPIYCRPVIYEPCVRWTYYEYPVWQPLPVATCGTWVDVEPVVIEQGNDLELLAVRFVDPGYPDQNKGPRYRAWLRNNGNTPIAQPFNVLAMGTPAEQVTEDRLEVGQRVPSIDAGQTIAVDLRFPISAADDLENLPELNKLHILVDSHREVNEANELNNGVVLDRGEVMSVDPAAFGVDAEIAETGGTLNLAGEGLGPEPGQVLLQMDGEQQEVEVLGWYDLGVQIQLPEVQMGDMTKAEIVVVRGDGAATNPLPIQIVQAGAGEQY